MITTLQKAERIKECLRIFNFKLSGHEEVKATFNAKLPSLPKWEGIHSSYNTVSQEPKGPYELKTTQ